MNGNIFKVIYKIDNEQFQVLSTEFKGIPIILVK